MKNLVLRRMGVLTIALVAMMWTGCKKDKNQEDTGYASEHATSEQAFDDVQSIADQAANVSAGPLGYKLTTSGCATVSKTPPMSGNPGIMTVDFGSSNCTCHDGRTRRGRIIITYTGNYADSGSMHTITFDNYYQNDNKVTGTKTVTNMGHNSSGQLWFTVHISGSVALKGGGTITTEWNRVRTWTGGYSTLTYLEDDVYQVTGSGTLTRPNGTAISIAITSPLVIAANCHWIEAGSVTFSIASGQTRILNFGDVPACDDQATVTLGNGSQRTITLQ